MCVLAMAASNAFAQAAPQSPAPQTATGDKAVTSLEEVVVTGSFIPTLPEDAAIPVEVINYEDLQNLGKPSNVDLIKNLTEVGQSIGELDRQTGYPIDAAAINLRNLGPRFTTVVFNNRRFPEQFSPAVGRFNNIASIPNAVIGNVEVLKSGGAAIYGADAVAGVVNYITRKNVTGLELNADYRYIPDSDGDYGVDGVWGTKLDEGNFMVAASYQHRSILMREDRDFSNRQYLENPGAWTSFGNPGAYIFQTGAATPANVTYANATGVRQQSATGVVRDPACNQLGGYAGLSATGSPICYGNYVPVERLVEESDQYSLFAELNDKWGNLDFHLEGLAYYRELPNASVITRTGILTFPVLGTPNGTGANAGLYDRILVSTTPSLTSTGLNPAVGIYLNNQFLNANGAPAYSPAQITSITNPAAPGRVALLSTIWTPYGAGGNPLGENFDYQRNTTTQYRLSGSLGGSLPEFLGTSLEWEVAATYHYTKDTRWTREIPTYKFQNALNGFGGAGCTQNPMPGGGGIPGAAGCYFFNPFSSAVPANLYTGVQNTTTFVGTGTYPGYDPGRGLQNNLDMIRWLYEDVSLKREYFNYILDPIIRGTLGWDLPGGPVAMALGGQFRRQDEHTDLSDNADRSINPCPQLPNGQHVTAPGLNPVTNVYNVPTSAFTGTAAACTGGLMFSKSATVLGAAGNNHRDEKRHYPVAAAFLEFKLPLLTTLNADIVGRYEKFYSDVTDVDNDVFVPSVAVKWDITDWVALRASYGETFSQVNPPAIVPPVPANGVIAGAATNGTYTSFDFPNAGVKPESGKNFSVGFIFRAGNFNGTLDYNAITIQDYTRTLTAANIVTAMLLPGELSTNPNALINCSSPLLTQGIPGFNTQPYAVLAGGACVQGVRGGAAGSQLNNVAVAGATGSAGAGGQLNGGAINFFGGQGQTNAGELVSNALDVSMSYRFDMLGGLFIPSVNGTWVTKYHFDDFVVAGVKIANGYDGVGYNNSSTGRLNQSVPEYRVGFGLLYTHDRHTINVIGRYIPSVINDDATLYNATLARNANIGPDTSVTGGCPAAGASANITTNLGNVPANSGTGLYGAPCTGYNAVVLSGTKLASYFNLDLVYRLQVTDQLNMSLNVTNVLDTDPSFARNQLSYDSGYGSPLGRTVELSASMKFK
jgi:iron complex outermembrane receptor protein